MSLEANKDTARQAAEMYNQPVSPELFDRLFAPELIIHVADRASDFAAAKASWTRPDRPFAEARNVVEDVIAEGDKVVTRERLRAVHAGALRSPFGPVPPTGKAVEVGRIVIRRFRDGKIAEVWVVSDRLGLLQQVGAISAASQ